MPCRPFLCELLFESLIFFFFDDCFWICSELINVVGPFTFPTTAPSLARRRLPWVLQRQAGGSAGREHVREGKTAHAVGV